MDTAPEEPRTPPPVDTETATLPSHHQYHHLHHHHQHPHPYHRDHDYHDRHHNHDQHHHDDHDRHHAYDHHHHHAPHDGNQSDVVADHLHVVSRIAKPDFTTHSHHHHHQLSHPITQADTGYKPQYPYGTHGSLHDHDKTTTREQAVTYQVQQSSAGLQSAPMDTATYPTAVQHQRMYPIQSHHGQTGEAQVAPGVVHHRHVGLVWEPDLDTADHTDMPIDVGDVFAGKPIAFFAGGGRDYASHQAVSPKLGPEVGAPTHAMQQADILGPPAGMITTGPTTVSTHGLMPVAGHPYGIEVQEAAHMHNSLAREAAAATTAAAATALEGMGSYEDVAARAEKLQHHMAAGRLEFNSAGKHIMYCGSDIPLEVTHPQTEEPAGSEDTVPEEPVEIEVDVPGVFHVKETLRHDEQSGEPDAVMVEAECIRGD